MEDQYITMREGPIDRISELPDMIRLHILSLVPRKFAIRTTVLSTKWRDVWRYRWPYETTISFCKESVGELTAEGFVHCVDEYLKDRGEKKVEILHLSFHPDKENQSNVRSWIEYAIANGVEEMYLDFVDEVTKGEAFLLPDCLNNGELLAVLCLQHCKFQPSIDFKKLNFLEVLCLKCVNITDSMIADAVTNCPHLEKLDLRQCLELRSIEITGENLKLRSLVVVECFNAHEIKILAPNLRTFHFSGVFMKRYTLMDVSSLEDVMMISGLEMGPPRSNWLAQSNWFEIAPEFTNVKVLTLCSRAVQQIVASKMEPVVLLNLQELQFQMDLMTDTNFSDITGFFRKCHCPKLEKIFIDLPINVLDPLLRIFLEMAQEQSPESDFGSLKIVKMVNFKGHKYEVELVSFFLRKAVALESMILVTPQEMDCVCWLKSTAVAQMKFPDKASANAKMVICDARDDVNGIHATHCFSYGSV